MMRNLRLALRMMLRDLRAGELHLLGLAIVIAVASLTSVGFLADRVGRALDREANQLLGGDLLLRADRPWPAQFIDEARARALQSATTVLFTSMASTGSTAALTGVKVVQEGYPLRGAIRIAPGPNQADAVAGRVPEPGELWLDERLFAELGVDIGESVGLGELEFRVGAMVSFESDRGANFFSLLPRAIFNLEDLEATGLLAQGSRATWRLHVAGPAAAVAAYEQWARARLERGQAVESIDSTRPEVRAALDQAQRFLRLAALLAVILAAVAVGLSARRFMARHLDGCAVMRVLGAGQAQVLGIVIGEFALFGLAAAAAGSALGWAVQWGLAAGLRELLATELPAPSLLPLAHGLVVGMALLAGFVLPQLLRLGRVSTLRVLRRELAFAEPVSGAAWALGLAALLALVFWIAADARLGAMVAAGFAVALGLFALAAWGVLWLAVRFKGAGSLRGGGWRYGVAALGRRMGASVIQTVALGVGMTALLLLTLVRADLLDNWRRLAPADAPNRFVINIQPDQRAGLDALFAAEGLPVPQIQPMIRGRMVAINDRAVAPEDFDNPRTRRLAQREFNLSYTAELPAGNAVEAGRWHGGERVPQFSVEKGLAQTFGLQVGDRVAFEVGGERVEAPISSVRRLDWDSMRVNFFFIAAPGLLETYPASLITSFHLPPSAHGFTTKLIERFPNLTVIDVAAVLAQVQAMTDKLIVIVQFVFGFAVLAGLVVLYAALQATHDERGYEFAMLRTLGARNRQVRQAVLAEFLVLGCVAGGLAGLGASAIGWVLAGQVFGMPYAPALAPVLAGALLGAAGVVGGGWLGMRGLLSRPPLVSLRALG
ncbi:ABC transporter permease [Thauera chlorobenzoica]|uniref:Putative heavy metal transporter permease n=1 Tax=Thauera chlorobenzoica TaxID=96773 RepID=A0A1H5RPW5_9RHOO|nr:FtsX-like permease family protein [Thauera chlorobenzoica]APR05205.1 putative heavy metal transporter permease [Thauera chlorobenzoica]SEF40403.1 putative ABC transport system permease protein [Thauera chlorobenzoica]